MFYSVSLYTFTHTAARSSKASGDHSFSTRAVDMSDGTRQRLDVGVSGDLTELRNLNVE